MARDIADTYQHKFDREFPDGAVCTWDRPGEHPVIYLIPRIEVTGAAGLDPVVTLTPLDRSRVLGPLQVISYNPAPAPWPPGVVRVMFAGVEDPMFWNPRVPAVLAGRSPEAEPE